MLIYAIGVVALVGIICIIKEIIYPYEPVVQYIKKNRPKNYNWVTGRDHGDVILDEEQNG